jgi:hypothetical protein
VARIVCQIAMVTPNVHAEIIEVSEFPAGGAVRGETVPLTVMRTGFDTGMV